MDTTRQVPIREVLLNHIRFSTFTRGRAEVRIAFHSGNALYGIYWGGDTDGWIPAKWGFPNGNFRVDGRKTDLDISIGDMDWRQLK